MPLVPASPRQQVKLAGILLATALALTSCAPKWSSARIPTYEPLPVDISGFPNAADKAKLAEIASFMRERLVARHVDAPHANAILWQFHYFAPVRYLDDDWLSNRIFKSYDDIVDHCCFAWTKLVDQPWRIMSLGLRQWAHEF